MNRYFYIIIGLFLFNAGLPVMSQTISIEKVKTHTGESALIHVTAENLTSVGAITLYFTFDSTAATYLGLENIDPVLVNNLNSGYDPLTGQIAIVWSNISGANFIQNTLFDLKFKLLDCTGSLISLAPGCEIAKTDLQILAFTKANGSLKNIDYPEIAIQPQGIIVRNGETAYFEIAASPVSEYSWKESSDEGISWKLLSENQKYRGVKTGRLEIGPVTAADSNKLYLCDLKNSGCENLSNQARLSINTSNGINDPSAKGAFNILLYPNPCSGNLKLSFTLTGAYKTTIDILDITGKLVLTVSKNCDEGKQAIDLPEELLKQGIYFVKSTFEEGKNTFTNTQRLIKL